VHPCANQCRSGRPIAPHFAPLLSSTRPRSVLSRPLRDGWSPRLLPTARQCLVRHHPMV